MELDFTIIASALKLAYALLALGLLFGFLRYLDHRIEKGKGTFSKMLKGAGVDQSALAKAIYYGARFVGAALLVGMVVGCTPAKAAGITDRYDSAIQDAVGDYWPDLPAWKLWKAQLYQESNLRPEVCSQVGACGLAQFMPGTWKEAVRNMGLSPAASPHDDIAIAAGAWYMAKQRAAWKAKRSTLQKHDLALASYNAGLGNILKAQARCGNARLWPAVAVCLPAVTGARNARETTGYVDRIKNRWWPQLEAAP